MIKLENVTRKYGSFTAVDNVSMAIQPGEIVGLLGHNGAGKTTIMKMITGFLEPTEGTITINDKEIGADRLAIQRQIGYLPENCPLYQDMTVVEYLDYMASLHGSSKGRHASLVAAAIGRTGLEEKAFQSIATLSRGYRQRTGVAQAILHEPDIIILDEPTNGLDPTQIQQMRRLITALAKVSTVIVSTHVLQEVQAICDRVIILNNGKKALDARLDELQTKGRLLVHFGGREDDPRPLIERSPGVVSTAALADNFQKNQSPYVSGLAVTMATGEDRLDSAARIATLLQENGYRLYGMQFESRNLETVFAEISAQSH
jgi:ABC-2 type transport system ATP-binding protein